MEHATDLSVGTGYVTETLNKLISIEQMHVNDVSAGMLEIAKQRLPLNTQFIQDDALNIHKHISANSQDLVCCHYFLSFCPIEEVLARAFHILKPGGYLSLMTSTKQNLKSTYADKPKIIKKILKIDKFMQNAGTPYDHQTCLSLLSKQGFLLIEDNSFTEPLSFNNIDETMSWAINTGWLAGYFSNYYYLKKFTAIILMQLWDKAFGLFPIVSDTDVSIVMVQKPGTITR